MRRQMRGQFSVVMRTAEGHKFRAQLGAPNSFSRPRKEFQNLPHRELATSSALVEGGSLVTGAGTQFLLVQAHVLEDIRRFLAVEVNQKLPWKRYETWIDPVTYMQRTDSELTTVDAALPLVVEPQRKFEEAEFSQTQMRAFTAADVKEGEYLGDWKVLRATDVLGVRMLEVG